MTSIHEWMAKVSPPYSSVHPFPPSHRAASVASTSGPTPKDDARATHAPMYTVGYQAAQFYQVPNLHVICSGLSFTSHLILKDLNLPQEVSGLTEEKQMAIAYAVEERNCIQAEVDLASRRCRLLVFAAHNQALRAQHLNTKLETAGEHIAVSVQSALEENPESSDPPHMYFPSRSV